MQLLDETTVRRAPAPKPQIQVIQYDRSNLHRANKG